MTDVEMLCNANAERRAFAEEVHAKYISDQRKARQKRLEAQEAHRTKLWKRLAHASQLFFLAAAVALALVKIPLAALSSGCLALISRYLEDFVL